jgi:hypothetical protein
MDTGNISRTDQPLAPKHKRRWRQYSLRTLMIIVTLFAVACSWLAVKMRQAKVQKSAVNTIELVGGMVWYDYQETAPRTFYALATTREPKWLRRLLSDDFFNKPVKVDMRFNSSKDDDWVKAINILPSLKTLLVYGQNVTDETLDNLSDLSNLEELRLSGGLISDHGLKNLGKFPNLHRLMMDNTQITDSGLSYVKNLKHLEELSLRYNIISDAAIPDLSKLSNLKLLDVERTAITVSGWAELKKALPNCKVLWQSYHPSWMEKEYHQ